MSGLAPVDRGAFARPHGGPGVQFDPEELAEQFRVGVPEARLLARPDGPAAPIPREHGIGTAA